jgi:protein gp37
MSANSSIEWTDKTWNPLAGCTPASEGCRNCYAAALAYRLERMGQAKYAGTARKARSDGRAVFTGRINLDERALEEPRRWRTPARVFVNSMSDLFHEAVPDAFIGRVWSTMLSTPQHIYQVLTKRPARMADVVTRLVNEGREKGLRAPDNIWLGTSVEDQAAANARIPHLLRTPAAVRFLSCEPLLGPIDLGRACPCGYYCDEDHGHIDHAFWSQVDPGIHWLIVGGESGPRRRPFDPDWARSLRDQCQAGGVAFFMKQMGGPANAKGGDLDSLPADLRIREMPR